MSLLTFLLFLETTVVSVVSPIFVNISFFVPVAMLLWSGAQFWVGGCFSGLSFAHTLLDFLMCIFLFCFELHSFCFLFLSLSCFHYFVVEQGIEESVVLIDNCQSVIDCLSDLTLVKCLSL